jgi:hypothetical protein
MDIPPSVTMTKRSLLRWFALSFGLLSGKESRQTVLNVLDSLFFFLLSSNTSPSTLDIQGFLKEKHNQNVSEKLIRYHLNKLIVLELLVRKNRKYTFNNSPVAEPNSLKNSFSHWIKQPVNSSLENIEGVLDKLSSSYNP